MSEMVEIMRSMREDSQARRASNRASSANLLHADGVEFAERNAGAHLIVSAGRDIIDFWPGTGLWIVRGSPIKRRGVHPLLRRIKKSRKEATRQKKQSRRPASPATRQVWCRCQAVYLALAALLSTTRRRSAGLSGSALIEPAEPAWPRRLHIPPFRPQLLAASSGRIGATHDGAPNPPPKRQHVHALHQRPEAMRPPPI